MLCFLMPFSRSVCARFSHYWAEVFAVWAPFPQPARTEAGSVSLSDDVTAFSPSSGMEPVRSENTTFFLLKLEPPPEPVHVNDTVI